MIENATLIFVVILSILSFVASYFQYKEKGILLNNAYIYASKEERKSMDKKPYYRQSAVVFITSGIIFLLVALGIIFRSGWIYTIMFGLMILLIIYAIASTIVIEKNKSK